jgi:hypothetical protein
MAFLVAGVLLLSVGNAVLATDAIGGHGGTSYLAGRNDAPSGSTKLAGGAAGGVVLRSEFDTGPVQAGGKGGISGDTVIAGGRPLTPLDFGIYDAEPEPFGSKPGVGAGCPTWICKPK